MLKGAGDRTSGTIGPEEVALLIDRYAAGPEQLRAAVAAVPPGALAWRPGPRKWSVHEVVVHCADSEVNAHGRIRYVLAEREPVIVAYDQDLWAEGLGYREHPLDVALATVVAVRANTVPLLRRLPIGAWSRMARHTETGEYTAAGWLRAYAEHLPAHVRQIERNVAAFRAESRS